jgi:eukaryotic-like serine/threonine-protein kinase
MADDADDDRLMAIAGAISDGRPVDWTQFEALVADGADAAILGELRALHQISAAHASTKSWDGLELGEIIGQGAFGTVYRGFDSRLEREIAVKISEPADDGAPFDPERAVREARLLAKVQHPNVVTVFGAQRRDDTVAVTMELVNGETLHQLVSQRGPMSASEATLIGLDLCRAIAAVHRANLLHGDIKAHNVMREAGGRIVLMDFGTGRGLGDQVGPGGDLAGTPLYLAPEVFLGRARSAASDIYSLGVLLFFLVTGSYPVDGETSSTIRQGHSAPETRRRLRDLRPDLPERFIAVVERALSTNPAERLRTAGEFETALMATLPGKGDVTPVNPLSLSRGSAVLLLSVAALALAALIAVVTREWPARAIDSQGSSAGADASVNATQRYRVEASMYRVDNGRERRLQPGERLIPSDRLFLRFRASLPVYVYVINEDDHGKAMLLFPLPGAPKTPLPASLHTLPGTQGQKTIYWQVTSPGVREHFVLLASPQPLGEMEQIAAGLAQPQFNAKVTTDAPVMPVAPEAGLSLRSVGGLVAGSTSAVDRLSARYTTPLVDGPEDVVGLWARQIVFANNAPSAPATGVTSPN